ncbi:hypothetical protein K456DRAFT_55622 [Colletotrichum gloeosporioides 23]|nr:hypothetical protein K456DRAFT_55622 [Colletotrichum gloeosporioides 23]
MGSFGGSRKGAADQSASVSEAIPARHRVECCTTGSENLWMVVYGARGFKV